MSWSDDQQWESEWWGDCLNTFGEEAKQITYAHRMGLVNESVAGHWPVYDLKGISVIDIGGGPASMLLKCINRGPGCLVLDPLKMPKWVKARYREAEIEVIHEPAEALTGEPPDGYDEAWIYNCLQHTQDPQQIVFNAVNVAKRVRIFEWLDTPVAEGHPHTLRFDELERWLSGTERQGEDPQQPGIVEDLTGENGCYGRAFYGVFSGVYT